MATVRSWRQMVLDADPDFQQESLRPVVYEFSNGRKFRQPFPTYSFESQVLTMDGDELTIDGDRLTMS